MRNQSRSKYLNDQDLDVQLCSDAQVVAGAKSKKKEIFSNLKIKEKITYSRLLL